METKVKLVKVLVFPIVLYGAETWTMRKHERRKIDAFELWCWRRVLRVSWMERKTNMSSIENIKPEWTLESRVAKAALSYFGHVVRAGGMEDDVMLGRMNGAIKRGRPRQRWVDTLKGYASGATISDMRRDARERERDGEELPRLSPGVGCDSTAQGDEVKVITHSGNRYRVDSNLYY